MKVINIEDNVFKHSAICKVLKQCGINEIEWSRNLADALNTIDKAYSMSEPFDLIITDMHYPLSPLGRDDWDAGEKLISEMEKRGAADRVIICSSRNLRYPEIYGSLWYSELSDWEFGLKRLVEKLQ